jgi:hypothetical protein
MAGSNAKKRLEANRAKLRSLQLTAAATTAFFLAVRVGVPLARGAASSSSASATWGGLAATLAAHALSYATVAGSAAPTYDARGGLVDGGLDLSRVPPPTKAAAVGLDLLYLTCLVQLAAAFSAYGFWLWALAPAYGAYAFMAPAFAYATGKRRRLRPQDFVTDEMREKEARAGKRREKRAAKRM